MNNYIIWILSSICMFTGGFLSGQTVNKCNIKKCEYEVKGGVFVLTNEDTIVIHNGQPFYFNEAEHKTVKTKEPKRENN